MKYYCIKNLRELVKAKGKKQVKIADEIGVKIYTIRNIYNGQGVTTGTFKLIKKYFGKKLEYTIENRGINGQMKRAKKGESTIRLSTVIRKLAQLRERQGIKFGRKEEIEKEVAFENEKAERVKQMYAKIGIKL